MKNIKTVYLPAVTPPALFVSVAVANRDGSIIIRDSAAHLDTAADWTVLPQRLIAQLGSVPTREVELTGFGGAVVKCSVFEVWLTLPTFKPVLLEITAHPNEPWILLGRDMLNRYQVLLDGPSQALQIQEP
jgi:predicted aspartyl protease